MGNYKKMNIEWSKIINPFLDYEPEVTDRDPLLFYNDGIFYCFYAGVEHKNGNFCQYIETVESTNLVEWTNPRRLTTSKLGFSSPGNIIKIGDYWFMSLQSYPIPEGKEIAGEDARLWYMKSSDLKNWEDPVQLKPEGATSNWSINRRQIDACFVEYDGKCWCLYKNSGCLGLLVSEDFKTWKEASPDRPIISKEETPAKRSLENPYVFKEGDEFILIYSPCREGRGIGMARSKDLLHWYDIHHLNFPELPWADNGASAGMVADLRDVCGKYVMVFHGERKINHEHSAALGIAWSDDLEHWTVPGS